LFFKFAFLFLQNNLASLP